MRDTAAGKHVKTYLNGGNETINILVYYAQLIYKVHYLPL